MQIKAIIIPGNGGSTPQDKWFPYVKKELDGLGITTINVSFPDPVLARKDYWLPFIEKLGADENTILIGHSSGALAAMRYAEAHKIKGSVLVGACHTDLGVQSERQSGYYNPPWKWDIIKNNQRWIVQFASTDDPYIPIEEARYVHNRLNTIYYEYNDQGHFGRQEGKVEFPELIEAIKRVMSK